MNKFITMTLLVAVAGCPRFAAAQPVGEPDAGILRTAQSERFLLSPPTGVRPVPVRASFQLDDINEINDEEETFEFTGVLTLSWSDERQVFDPVAVGVDEKVYQGAYQFNEVFTGWFPQVVLVNDSGVYDERGVVVRVKPNGTVTLIVRLNAAAEADFDMRRFPFDRQRLEAVFEVLGFDREVVVLEVESATPSSLGDTVRIPQWTITGLATATRDRPGPRGISAAFVVIMEMQRDSFFIARLVLFPLILIVLLSFSVFWMERSSVGDRISVSFIGILTVVTYQIVVSEILPGISYMTLMNAFLNFSFFTMCATVVINLVVAALDKNGKFEVGDRIDRRCRWLFPVVYFGLLLLSVVITFTFF